MFTIELNNVKRDYETDKIKSAKSPVVEVFSAMVDGKSLEKFGKKGDVAAKYIKELASKAENGDFSAISEYNAIKRFAIEPRLMEEIKLLGLFGAYESVGYGDSIERESYEHIGEKSRVQAANGDVVFPTIAGQRYSVSSETISGGYQTDYRKVQFGDMSKENEGMEQVRIDIRNKAALYVVNTVYNSIKNAVGIKYYAVDAGLTKTNLDKVIKNVRRLGKPTIAGDYSAVSQINDFAPYTNGTFTNISDAAMEEIRKTGLINFYNGTPVVEIPNQYDYAKLNAAGDNYATLLPEGLIFVIPNGVKSPVKTWTRGGLTTCTGTDVTTGRIITRFDLEVACDVAKGHESDIGLIVDSNLMD